MMIRRKKYNIWKKSIAMVVVCLFLVNQLAWAYPDALATQGLSDENTQRELWEAITSRKQMQELQDNPLERIYREYEIAKQKKTPFNKIRAIDRTITERVVTLLTKELGQAYDCDVAMKIGQRLQALVDGNIPDADKLIVSGVNLIEDPEFTIPHAGRAINIPYHKGMTDAEIANVLLHEAISGCIFGDSRVVHELASNVLTLVNRGNLQEAAARLSGVMQSPFPQLTAQSDITLNDIDDVSRNKYSVRLLLQDGPIRVPPFYALVDSALDEVNMGNRNLQYGGPANEFINPKDVRSFEEVIDSFLKRKLGPGIVYKPNRAAIADGQIYLEHSQAGVLDVTINYFRTRLGNRMVSYLEARNAVEDESVDHDINAQAITLKLDPKKQDIPDILRGLWMIITSNPVYRGKYDAGMFESKLQCIRTEDDRAYSTRCELKGSLASGKIIDLCRSEWGGATGARSEPGKPKKVVSNVGGRASAGAKGLESEEIFRPLYGRYVPEGKEKDFEDYVAELIGKEFEYICDRFKAAGIFMDGEVTFYLDLVWLPQKEGDFPIPAIVDILGFDFETNLPIRMAGLSERVARLNRPLLADRALWEMSEDERLELGDLRDFAMAKKGKDDAGEGKAEPSLKAVLPSYAEATLRALEATGGHQARAAERLGVGQQAVSHRIDQIRTAATELNDNAILARLDAILARRTKGGDVGSRQNQTQPPKPDSPSRETAEDGDDPRETAFAESAQRKVLAIGNPPGLHQPRIDTAINRAFKSGKGVVLRKNNEKYADVIKYLFEFFDSNEELDQLKAVVEDLLSSRARKKKLYMHYKEEPLRIAILDKGGKPICMAPTELLNPPEKKILQKLKIEKVPVLGHASDRGPTVADTVDDKKTTRVLVFEILLYMGVDSEIATQVYEELEKADRFNVELDEEVTAAIARQVESLLKPKRSGAYLHNLGPARETAMAEVPKKDTVVGKAALSPSDTLAENEYVLQGAEYDSQLATILNTLDTQWAAQGVDGVIGIPFYREDDATVQNVLAQVQRGLQECYPDRKFLVIAVGEGTSKVDIVNILPEQTNDIHSYGFYKTGRLLGKGWSLRMFLDVADRLNAHAVFFDADIINIAPDWLSTLLEPVFNAEGASCVIPTVSRRVHDAFSTNHIAYPVLCGIYGQAPRHPLGGVRSLSREAVRQTIRCIEEMDSDNSFSDHGGRFGIDVLLSLLALKTGAEIHQLHLGQLSHTSAANRTATSGVADYFQIFSQVIDSIFEYVRADSEHWVQQAQAAPVNIQQPSQDASILHPPDDVVIRFIDERFKDSFRDTLNVTREVVRPELVEQLERYLAADYSDVYLSAEDWAEIVHSFMLEYSFGPPNAKQPLLQALFPIFWCRVASYLRELPADASPGRIDAAVQRTAMAFRRRSPALAQEWLSRSQRPDGPTSREDAYATLPLKYRPIPIGDPEPFHQGVLDGQYLSGYYDRGEYETVRKVGNYSEEAGLVLEFLRRSKLHVLAYVFEDLLSESEEKANILPHPEGYVPQVNILQTGDRPICSIPIASLDPVRLEELKDEGYLTGDEEVLEVWAHPSDRGLSIAEVYKPGDEPGEMVRDRDEMVRRMAFELMRYMGVTSALIERVYEKMLQEGVDTTLEFEFAQDINAQVDAHMFPRGDPEFGPRKRPGTLLADLYAQHAQDRHIALAQKGAEPEISFEHVIKVRLAEIAEIEQLAEPRMVAGEERWDTEESIEEELESYPVDRRIAYVATCKIGGRNRVVGWTFCVTHEGDDDEVDLLQSLEEEQPVPGSAAWEAEMEKEERGQRAKRGRGGRIEILKLKEHPDYGHLGVADALMGKIVERQQKMGYGEIVSEVALAETDVLWRDYLQGHGFDDEGRRAQAFEDSEPTYRMARGYWVEDDPRETADGSPAVFANLTGEYQTVDQIKKNPKLKNETFARDLLILTQAEVAQRKNSASKAADDKFKISDELAKDKVRPGLVREYLNYLFAKTRGNVRTYTKRDGRANLATALKQNFVRTKKITGEDAVSTYDGDAKRTFDIAEYLEEGNHYTVTVGKAVDKEAIEDQVKIILRKRNIRIEVKTAKEDDAPTYTFTCRRGGELIGETSINLHAHPTALDRTNGILNLGLASSTVPQNLEELKKRLTEKDQRILQLINYVNEQFKTLDLVGSELIKIDTMTPQRITEILHTNPITIVLPPVEKPDDLDRKFQLYLQSEALKKHA